MSSRQARHVPLASVGIGLGGMASLILGFLTIADDNPLVSLPFVGLVSMPVVLATIGLTRPPALLAAGVISLPVSLISLAGATLPLLIPAAFYLVAYGRAPVGKPRVHPAAIMLFVIGAGIGSFLLTAYGTETRCTIRGVSRHGETFQKEVNERRTHRLGPSKGGRRITESSCSEGPGTTNIVTAMTLIFGTVALVWWMSKVTPQQPDAPRTPRAPHAPRAPLGTAG
jgi:hypothetical protein